MKTLKKLSAAQRSDAFCKNAAAVIAQLNGSGEMHFDAGETLFFARQLEHIFAQTYRVEYPAFKGRTLLNVNYNVPNWAEEHTYRWYDHVGEADFVSDYSDEFPNGEIFGGEVTNKVVPIGASYTYSIQDLRVAQGTGFNLTNEKVVNARFMVEQKLDRLIAQGSPVAGKLGGFLKDAAGADVGTQVTSAGTWVSGAPTDANNLSVIGDIQTLIQSVWQNTKQIRTARRLLVSTKIFMKLQQKVSTFDNSSILDYVQRTFGVRVEPWLWLDQAVDATHDKMIAYDDSPEVGEIIIPQEYEQFAPQQKNLAFYVPVHMRYGGITIRYPKAISWMSVLTTSLFP